MENEILLRHDVFINICGMILEFTQFRLLHLNKLFCLTFHLAFYPRLRKYLYAEDSCVNCLRKVLVHIRVDLGSRSSRRPTLIAHIVHVTVKQWSRNSKIFLYHSVVDNEMISKYRTIQNVASKLFGDFKQKQVHHFHHSKRINFDRGIFCVAKINHIQKMTTKLLIFIVTDIMLIKTNTILTSYGPGTYIHIGIPRKEVFFSNPIVDFYRHIMYRNPNRFEYYYRRSEV